MVIALKGCLFYFIKAVTAVKNFSKTVDKSEIADIIIVTITDLARGKNEIFKTANSYP